MKIINDENEARRYLRELKDYYMGLVIQGAIFIVCLLIWLFSGGGPWPIFVLLAFGIHSFIGGVKLGVFPMIQDFFPFMKKDWEEAQLQKMKEEDEDLHNRIH